jgi:hypothetical protein
VEARVEAVTRQMNILVSFLDEWTGNVIADDTLANDLEEKAVANDVRISTIHKKSV